MEQDYLAAISLYLNSGLSMKAAQVAMNADVYIDDHIISSVLNSLTTKGLFDTAGDFLLHLQRPQEAKDMFQKCKRSLTMF